MDGGSSLRTHDQAAPVTEVKPTSTRRLLVLLAAVSLGLWILVILATLVRSEEFDPYWVLTIPGIEHALSSGFLAVPTDTPGWQILMVSTSTLTGLPLERLLFMPFGGLAAFPTSYVLFRRLVGSGYPTLLMSIWACFRRRRDARAGF